MNDLADHLKKDRFAAQVGIERFVCADGYWTVRLKIEDRHLNGLDVAHGGLLFTLADSAFAIASNSDGRTSTGIQTSMSFFAPVSAGMVLWASIREMSRRNTLSVYEVELLNEANGERVALFTGTAFRIWKK